MGKVIAANFRNRRLSSVQKRLTKGELFEIETRVDQITAELDYDLEPWYHAQVMAELDGYVTRLEDSISLIRKETKRGRGMPSRA